jgi:nitroreductase
VATLDAYLCIVSKREVRQYSDRPIAEDVLERILQAGRATGSSRNRQQWRLVVVRGQETLAQVADTVAAPENVRGCQLAIAVVLENQSPWDGGRLAQNLMLAAWSLGVGTCPNTPTPPNRDECKRLLGLPDDADIVTILSCGYPAEPVPRGSDADAILARIDRKPLSEIVRFVGEGWVMSDG